MIKCDDHDHFEIACMHKSHVRVRLKSGEYTWGIAQDIVTKNKQEFLVIKHGDELFQLELMEIEQLEYDQETIDIQ
jgi:transcriptional antiterminator Rof (Rho-off)